ncbi:hypothetical protein JCM3775_006866 [Rhodotorula graminis]
MCVALPPHERSPLLAGNGTSDQGHTRTALNPRAPSFKLDHPRAGDAAASRPPVVAPSAVAVAAAPAPPPAPPTSQGLPSNALLVDSSADPAAHDSDSPAASTSSLLTATAGAPRPFAHPHAHFVSTSDAHGHGHGGPSPRPGSPTSSQSSFSSLSSHYSLLPLRTFRNYHLVQFALTFLFLFVVPVVVVVVLAHQLRWEAFLLGVASWLASEQLREVVFELFTPAGAAVDDGDDYDTVEVALEEPLPPVSPSRAHGATHLALPTIVHALAQEALRLGAVALVVKLLPSVSTSTSTPSPSLAAAPHSPHERAPLPPLDPLFWSALWLGLGSAMTEILWGSHRLWKQLELYADVLPRDGDGRDLDEEGVLRGVGRRRAAEHGHGHGHDEEEEDEYRDEGEEDEQEYSVVECFAGEGPGYERGLDGTTDGGDDEEFQRRLRAVQRDELEAQLGVPLPEVPVGVVFIWRLDSILLSLIFTLLLSLPFRLTPPSLFTFRLAPTFAFAALTHAALAYAWLATVKTYGIPSVSFASLVALLGMLFGVLGAWGVLV